MFKITARVSVQERTMSGCSKSQETFCGINYRAG